MLLESVDGDVAEGRAAHQGPEVDGTTTVERAARGRPRRRPRASAVVAGSDGADLVRARPPRDRRAADARVSNWNLPNALTTLRIVMVPFFGWALLVDGGDSVLWRCVAWVLFAVAMITDKIDGDIARSRNLVTNFGKIADPIADKALTGMAFVGPLDRRRHLVVGDDPGAGPRVGGHPAAALGDPARRDGGRPRRQAQDRAPDLRARPASSCRSGSLQDDWGVLGDVLWVRRGAADGRGRDRDPGDRRGLRGQGAGGAPRRPRRRHHRPEGQRPGCPAPHGPALELVGGADQRQVREGLREVADEPPVLRVVLLREQADVVGQLEQPLASARAASSSRPASA